METECLIVFVKNPVLGKVKTRLAKSIGEKLALKVYEDLMERCREVCLSINANRFLFYSAFIERDNWSKDHFIKKKQIPGSLGDKIKNAFCVVQKEKRKTIIIGSDCYDLNKHIINSAFKELDEYDLVIGPANDGGYYLLGTKKYLPSIFNNISWSSEKVLDQTIGQAKKLNLTYTLLDELVDIDTLEDISISSYSRIFKTYD